ncbi:hypothetical protein ANCDUO_15397, partial [Ancylostoma duodenale]
MYCQETDTQVIDVKSSNPGLVSEWKRRLSNDETDTQVIDVQSSNPGLVSEWKRRLSNDVDIITAIIRPDSNRAGDGGLGISLEG